MAKRTTAVGWTNRVVRHGVARADSFLANESNWRVHPRLQQDALRSLIGHEVGWVRDVLVNLRTSRQWKPGERGVETMVDGHIRVQLALQRGDDTMVPVAYVDLDPREERLVLLSLDPIGTLAVPDEEKFQLLRDELPELAVDLIPVADSVLPATRRAARVKGLRHKVISCKCCTPETCKPGCGCYVEPEG